MKTIYLIKCDNGEECEDYEEYTFKYCYSSYDKALEVMKELSQDNDYLESVCRWNNYWDVNFWIEMIELVD